TTSSHGRRPRTASRRRPPRPHAFLKLLASRIPRGYLAGMTSLVSRRRFLTGSAALFAATRAAASDSHYVPFDKLMEGFIEEHTVPGAALAVSHNREIVYSKGFGLADTEKKSHVEADSLFRIASISKPITAAAVLQLVDARRVKLDDPVLDYVLLKAHVEKDA